MPKSFLGVPSSPSSSSSSSSSRCVDPLCHAVSSSRWHVIALVLVLASNAVSVGPARAAEDVAGEAAPGKHCLGEGKTKLVVSEVLAGQLNPVGAEHQLQAGICVPFIRTPGVLFDFTNVQAGVLSYVSAPYTHAGAFVSVMPLSVLQLRAEAARVWVWPFPLDAAGYFPRRGYDADFSRLPADAGSSTEGWSATFEGTLQAQVEVTSTASLIVMNSTSYEYWRLGDAAQPYYYNLRRDLLLARSDWLFADTGTVLFQLELETDMLLRAGITNELRWVPASGYKANIASGIVTLALANVGGYIELQPFVRAGAYTEHAFRDGLMLLAGVSAVYDLSKR